MVDAVSTKVNSYDDGYVFNTDEYLVVPINCVELEQGSNTNSPFGPYIPEQSFILVTRKENSQGFEYYVSAKDEVGYGTKLSLSDEIEIKIVNDNEVGKITEEGLELGSFSSIVSGKTSKIKTCESFDIDIDEDSDSALLRNKILEDNEEQSDVSIDFSQISSATNGEGLYYTNANTENSQRTYYFRGAVENNYVQFAGFYWRIIRINEDGSVRLIYQGETPNATSGDTIIGRKSAFNSSYNNNAHIGYMNGGRGNSTYAETHANINDSTIKERLDTWYEENLLSYASYLADSGFCGDRSIANGRGGVGTLITYYGAYNRLYSNKTPQFSCPQSNDLYTTSSSNKGNKALDCPIGLITADEVAYAGGIGGSLNKNYYLYTGDYYWTMSPSCFNGSRAIGWSVYPGGYLVGVSVDNSFGIRPVINLVSGIEITSGDGTISNPYVINTN